jgi:hypothetical protein
LIDRIGGAFSKQPEEIEQGASEPTRKLIDQAFDGINPERVVDYHTHMLAIGTSAADAFVNPKMRDGINLERLKFRIYVSGAGVRNIENADQEYVERLLRLTRGIKRHGKYRILAFDQHYNADGTVDLKKTNMYVPNRYVVELAGKNPTFLHRSFRSIPTVTMRCRNWKLGRRPASNTSSGCPMRWAWTRRIPPSSLSTGK